MNENEKKLYLENQKLKKENTELKRRIKKYIYENQELEFLVKAKLDKVRRRDNEKII